MADFSQKAPGGDYRLGTMESALTTHFVPKPRDFEIVDVEVRCDALMEYVDAYFSRMEGDMFLQGGGSSLSLTRAELASYVRTLIASRIRHSTRGVREGTPPPVVAHHESFVLVPPFIAEALENIGKVRLDSVGIDLIPKEMFQQEELLTRDQMHAVSRQLELMKRFGYIFAIGYRRDDRGDESFMSLQCVDGMVRSHTDTATTIKAVFAYFLGMVQVRVLLGHRIEYCHFDEAKTLIWDLAARY